MNCTDIPTSDAPTSDACLEAWLRLHQVGPEAAESIRRDFTFHQIRFGVRSGVESESAMEEVRLQQARAMHRLQALGLLPLNPPRPWLACEDEARYALSKRMGFSWI